MTRDYIWWGAFKLIKQEEGLGAKDASEYADRVLMEYNKRFPKGMITMVDPKPTGPANESIKESEIPKGTILVTEKNISKELVICCKTCRFDYNKIQKGCNPKDCNVTNYYKNYMRSHNSYPKE